MPNEILNWQIEALLQDLERIEDLLKSSNVKPQYLNPIMGKFGLHISARTEDLKVLKTKLAGGLGAVDAWKKYADIWADAQKVFDQCLDWLGGIAVRDMKLEKGICGVAEDLVRHYATQTGVSWTSVMILGDERPFDDVALRTQILRLQFPRWDLWNLPLITYEYGQLVAADASLDALTTFALDEQRKVEKWIKDPVLQAQDQPLAAEIDSLRQRYQADPQTTLEDFLARLKLHIRGLFADAFSTYFLGPAYVYTQLFLRVMPTQILREDPNKCSFARRVAFMLRTLQEMSNAGKPSQYDPGPYDGEINRLRDLWQATIPGMYPGYGGSFEFGKPYDDWVVETYANLRKPFGKRGFQGNDWEQARELAPKLLDQDPPGASIPVILNAAWVCRIKNPDRAIEIEKSAFRLLVGPKGSPPPTPGGGGPTPQRT